MKGSYMISIRLDENLESQLNLLSQEQHISKSKVVKDALSYYFNMLKIKSKTPYEIGSELFGKYSSGDGALSTTYKEKIKDKIDAKNSSR
jgi:16S rRNA A1518/A1519 N6-dimethyltransferase RsmA/KsgA/DIM1 with predicted DNA glycosylase/AP lyase activity